MKNLLNKMKENKDIPSNPNMNYKLWSEEMLRMAVKKGSMTIAEFEQTTNKTYL